MKEDKSRNTTLVRTDFSTGETTNTESSIITKSDCNKHKRQRGYTEEGHSDSSSSAKTSSGTLSDYTDEPPMKDVDECQAGSSLNERGVITYDSFTIGESKVTYPTIPPVNKDMSSADRKERRRLRNRISAQQHRERQRTYVDTLKEQIDKRDLEIDKLIRRVESIKKEHEEKLCDIHKRHACELKQILTMKDRTTIQLCASDEYDVSKKASVMTKWPQSAADRLSDGKSNSERASSPLISFILADRSRSSNDYSSGNDMEHVTCSHGQLPPSLIDSMYGAPEYTNLGPLHLSSESTSSEGPLLFPEACGNVFVNPQCLENVEPDVEVANQLIECADHYRALVAENSSKLPPLPLPTQNASRSTYRRPGGCHSVISLLLGAVTLGLFCFSSLTQVCVGG